MYGTIYGTHRQTPTPTPDTDTDNVLIFLSSWRHGICSIWLVFDLNVLRWHLHISILIPTLLKWSHTPAYIAGICNFCSVVNNLIGSGVIQWSGMKTVGKECNFEALPYLVGLLHVLLPLIATPAVFLIPNVLQTEHLIDWETEGWYLSERTD